MIYWVMLEILYGSKVTYESKVTRIEVKGQGQRSHVKVNVKGQGQQAYERDLLGQRSRGSRSKVK